MITKTLNLQSGFALDHWRVAVLQIDNINKHAVVKLNGYKDQATYDSDPVGGIFTTREWTFDGANFDTYFSDAAIQAAGSNTRAAENCVVALIPQFNGAVIASDNA